MSLFIENVIKNDIKCACGNCKEFVKCVKLMVEPATMWIIEMSYIKLFIDHKNQRVCNNFN